MYDPLGLSIGTTNLVAVRSGTPPVSRRAVLTLFPDRAPELGLPDKDSANPDTADTGTLMAGFVERVGGSHVLKSADGSTHDPALLLVEALDVLTSATGGKASTSNITMAVPAHWGQKAMRGLQDALSTHADFVHGGIAPRLVPDSVAALTALNARLRDDYTHEIQAAVDRWNRIPARFGIQFRVTLPHAGFHRKIGSFAGHFISPDGQVLSEEAWNRQAGNWLPVDADHGFVDSLMGRVIEPGKFANWIAPPARGINSLPIEFEYVRFD